MTCDELRRHLSLHLDSELTPETAGAMAAHAEACAPCRDRLAAEERVEAKIRAALGAPQDGDAEAWARAVGAIPRRRAWPWVAAAALLAAAGAFWFFARHRELDLAVEMLAHHEKVLAGKSPAEVEGDAAAVNAFFKDKYPFSAALRGPLPAGTTLAGGRPCYLAGAPTAYFIVHRGATAITVAVFAPEGLEGFPMARERLVATGRLHCKVQAYDIVAHRSTTRVVVVFGACAEATLHEVASAFE